MNDYSTCRPPRSQAAAPRVGRSLTLMSGLGALLLVALLLVFGGEQAARAARPAGIGAPGDPDWTQQGVPLSYYGFSVSGVGDVDNDGYDDFLVGAPLYDEGGQDIGQAYLYRGASGGLTSPAFDTFMGELDADQLGHQVAPAGDINGDGAADFLIGAPNADTIAISDTGKVFVYLGQQTPGSLPTVDKSLHGEAAGDQFGWSAGAAGDVNGDGYDDIIVGAHYHDRSLTDLDTGKVYVYHGAGGGIEAAPAFTATGELALDFFGSAVDGAGDVNGDGYDDIIIGARGNDESGQDAGKVYVYHGGPSGLSATPAFTDVGTDVESNFGNAVAGAGDINGDGYADVIVGAPTSPAVGEYAGKVYVYLGSPGGLLKPAAFVAAGENGDDKFGVAVAGAGDVNGDGFDDLIVGARGYQASAGRAYIYAGCAGGPQATAIFTATGEAAGNNFGRSVSGAGDVNNDGLDDAAVGAYGAGGKAYVYHGDAAVGVCAAQIELAQTLGSGGEQPACTDAITVSVKSGEAVAFCYTVTNTGSAPLNRHSLTTSVYSEVFAGLPYDLAPGESYAFSVTYPVTYTMDNIAVWTSEWASAAPALAAGSVATPTITASGTATATVVIVEGGLYLPVIHKP